MKHLIALIPANLDFESNKNKDKYYFIITFIVFGRIFDKRKDIHSFIQLYSPFLKAILSGHYSDILKELIDMNIIEGGNHYRKGKKSKAYRLTDNYRTIKLKRVEITDKKIISNYHSYKSKKNKKITETAHNYLYSCLKEIRIDYEAAIDYMNKNAESIEQYNYGLCAIEMIHNSIWYFVTDKKAGRVHNNLTNFPKVLRPFLFFLNKRLIEIDISNSQPLLFNILINRYLLRDTSAYYYYNKESNIPYVPQHSDLRKYKEVTETGKFYEFMMEKLNIKEDRDKFKVRMFTKIFYGKDKESEEMSLFKKIFPTVAKIISYYKRVNYKNLAIELQTVEADMIINRIVPKLAKENIFVLTIHDSILTTEENCDSVVKIILSEFKKINLKPNLKIKNRTEK